MSDTRGELLGFGSSTDPDPALAARQSIEQALAGRVPGERDLVMVHPTTGYDQQLFAEAAAEAAGAAQLIGCTSYGSFTARDQVNPGVVAGYLPAGDLSFGVGCADSISGDIFGAAERATLLAQERAGDEADHSVLLVLTDGFAGDQREVVRGTYAVTGSMVPLVGGAASDFTQMTGTCQFAEGKVMTNGLVAVWINSPRPLGVGVDHGWHPVGEPMIVTRAEGNVIHELDGHRAVDVYLSRRGSDLLTDRATGDVEADFAAATYDHPLGLATATGRFDGRHILGRTEDGALVMFGHVSEQSVVQVMAGDWTDLVAAAGRATADAAGQLERPSRGALVFSCAGRVPPLGEHVAAEAQAVSQALDGLPVGGFFTFGEFARVTGSTGFHNATVGILAF